MSESSSPLPLASSPPPERPPWYRVAFISVTAVGALGLLWFFGDILAPFLLAILIAYILAPVVRAMERIRIGRGRCPRWVAVVLVYAALVGGMIGGVVVGTPWLASELQKLSHELPSAIAVVRDSWLPAVDRAAQAASSTFGGPTPSAPTTAAEPSRVAIEVTPRPAGGFDIQLPAHGVDLVREDDGHYVLLPSGGERTQRKAASELVQEAITRELSGGERSLGNALRTAQVVVSSVVQGVFRFVIMLMISAYLLLTSDEILGFFRRLVRRDRLGRFDRLLDRVDRGLSGVVRGQIIICFVNGILSAIGFYAAGLSHWFVLSLVAAAFSIVPIFGSIISSIPVVLIALQQGPWLALFVLGWIVLIHQLEANVLNPKIMGDSAHIHPVLVVFALLAGEHVFGLTGALLAVPVLSIGQSFFLHYEEVALRGDPR